MPSVPSDERRGLCPRPAKDPNRPSSKAGRKEKGRGAIPGPFCDLNREAFPNPRSCRAVCQNVANQSLVAPLTMPRHDAPMTDLLLGPVVPEAFRPLPAFEPHIGRSVILEPLTASHVGDLWDAAKSAETSWTYLRYGPFPTEGALAEHVGQITRLEHQPFFAVLPNSSGKAEGWASFCDIAPADSAVEIGSIWFSPRLQRTRAATEAIFLMMEHAFALGYHRVVWRCNALNAASMRAARRFGFTGEGTWRGDGIVKGRRRDTAWFSILETEWPAQRASFEKWLDDSNFDRAGKARRSLSEIAR